MLVADWEAVENGASEVHVNRFKSREVEVHTGRGK